MQLDRMCSNDFSRADEEMILPRRYEKTYFKITIFQFLMLKHMKQIKNFTNCCKLKQVCLLSHIGRYNNTFEE